ncbi:MULTISPECIES: adenine deaminase C-terminal domain-containing protein [Fusobacterium]|uniref:adenine deaminase C-terminal domain-containing protein n=1 Tax=Fusobacterium TaxID=848 RepID=UPI001F1026CD|nr:MULTISPECIES: adenine deaminase C-terminal domain-containing protein [Fusobacterium]
MKKLKILELGKEIEKLRFEMRRQGYKHYNPIMSLCTLSLPVSPALKITDKGLIDVSNSKIVNLLVD